jgi:hypothetical protein
MTDVKTMDGGLEVEGIRALRCTCGNADVKLEEIVALMRVACPACGETGQPDGNDIGAVLRWNREMRKHIPQGDKETVRT